MSPNLQNNYPAPFRHKIYYIFSYHEMIPEQNLKASHIKIKNLHESINCLYLPQSDIFEELKEVSMARKTYQTLQIHKKLLPSLLESFT